MRREGASWRYSSETHSSLSYAARSEFLHIRFTLRFGEDGNVALGKANTPLVIKAAYRVYLDLNL